MGWAVALQPMTEDGMRGGYVWCTDKANRNLMRAYLQAVSA
jgi:hypothetical protein